MFPFWNQNQEHTIKYSAKYFLLSLVNQLKSLTNIITYSDMRISFYILRLGENECERTKLILPAFTLNFTLEFLLWGSNSILIFNYFI